MAPVPQTLPELVEQLGRTFSPFERLKILTRAWGLLRRMKPEERLLVAAQLGLDHADDLVEALAERRGGAPPAMLLGMIEKAQMKGTAHLPQLLSDLRDPKRRGERLTEGALRAIEATLAGGVAAPAPPPPQARPVAAPAPPPQKAASAPPARTDTEDHGRISPAPPPPPPPEPVPAVLPAPRAAAPVPPPRPEPPAPAPPPAPPPAVSAAGDGALVKRLAETPSLVTRFRLLRDHLESSKPAGDLHAVLDLFPDGWARRRALATLLEAGMPEKTADAVSLLGTLASERDRLWCLGALAGSRPVSGADREHFFATITSPAARRRLERRFVKGAVT